VYRALISPLALSVVGALAAGAFGYSVGGRLTDAKWVKKENRQLQAEAVRTADLLTINRRLQNAYVSSLDAVRAFEQRSESDRRVRDRAQRDAAIARSSADSLRVYASGAADVAESCIDEYRSMAAEAARASAAAYALR
jgi:hypothetical protein